MTDALYERYKDALRRGHVAALRDRLDAALVAYAEAAELAPERPLPHASMGGVLRRLGRHEEALAAFARALERAPGDETALDGRAEALAALGRPVQAADALDRLANVLDAAGRLPEACDAARRALELAESRSRRRHLEAIARRLVESPPDEARTAALGRAERVLGAMTAPAPPPEPEPDAETLAADAEALLDAGDASRARDRLLAAARAYRTEGRAIAAVDACYQALAVAPDDLDLHLALADLYLEVGWRAHATDKLVLLARLARLQEDAGARERLCAIVAERLPDEPRLASICR
jgi:tetratricopeptide (TPR) repeat protein